MSSLDHTPPRRHPEWTGCRLHTASCSQDQPEKLEKKYVVCFQRKSCFKSGFKQSGAVRRKCSARNVETSCCFFLHDRSCQAVVMTLMAAYLLVHKNPKAFFPCAFTFPVTSSPSAAAPSAFTTRCIIYVQSRRRKTTALTRRESSKPRHNCF